MDSALVTAAHATLHTRVTILLVCAIAVGTIVSTVTPASALSRAAPLGFKTISPPFHGVVVTSGLTQSRGCGAQSFSTIPFFHLKTGVGGMRGNSSARSCTTPLSNFGTLLPFESVDIHLPRASGTPTVFVNFTYQASISLNESPGLCTAVSGATRHGCESIAIVYWFVSVYAVNTTSSSSSSWLVGKFSPIHQVVYNETSCGLTTCHVTHSNFSAIGPKRLLGQAAIRFTFSTSMIRSVNYSIVVQMNGTIGSEIWSHNAALTGASANARLVMAYNGDGLKLSSIAES